MQQVPGVLFPIKLKLVSRQTLKKHARGKVGETINGLYDTDANLIYVVKTLPEAELLHTLMHEMAHAMEYQISGMEEEARVDAIASWLVKLTGYTSWQQVVINDSNV